MVEISSQQFLNTSRGAKTSSPSAVNVSAAKPSNAFDEAATDEQTPAQTRQQNEYDRAVSKQLQQLESRDREVRAHEAAHVAAGGKFISGGPSYTYQRGPNGRYYAIGGEVQIDVSPVPSNPQATLDKAEVVRRAALAPAQPSSQDLSVASNATRLASKARVDIAIQQREQQAEAANQKAAKESDRGSESAVAAEGGAVISAGYTTNTLAEPARDVFDIVA